MRSELTYLPFSNLKTREKKVDENKINEARAKFCGTCKLCGEPLVYIGGNILVCKNDACKGYKHEKPSADGTVKVTYTPVFRLLDEQGEKIANKLFD